MAGASSARRVQLNRAAFDEITLAAADGMFELAKSIVNNAHVPDAPPIGLGLIQGGGVLAYVGSKRVGVYSKYGATSVKKPRAAKLDKAVTVIGGYGFPAMFVESGTIHMAAEPFLTPELLRQIPDAGPLIQLACIRRRIISATRQRVGDVYGATNVSKEAYAEVRAVTRAVNKVGA